MSLTISKGFNSSVAKKAIVYRVTDYDLVSLLLSVCCNAVVAVAKPVSSSLAVTKTVEISLYFNW